MDCSLKNILILSTKASTTGKVIEPLNIGGHSGAFLYSYIK